MQETGEGKVGVHYPISINNSLAISEEELDRLLIEAEYGYSGHQNRALLERWRQGELIANFLDNMPRGAGRMDFYDKRQERTGIHRNTLRVCVRVYDYFNRDIAQFEKYLEDKQKVPWYRIEALVKANTDPEVLGEDAWYTRIVSRVERLSRDLDELNTKAAAGDEDAINVMSRAVEEVSAFQRSASRILGAPATPRSREYMDFVRGLPCAVTGKVPSDPHHTLGRGMGIKGSDFSCIPLCREAHTYLHDHGVEEFQRYYGVNVAEVVADTLHMWITGKHIDSTPMEFEYDYKYRDRILQGDQG